MSSSTIHHMPFLLKLPLEVRNEIYRWVIDSVIQPPASPTLEQASRQPLHYRNYLNTAIIPQPIPQDSGPDPQDPRPIPQNRQSNQTRNAWYRSTNPALSLLQVNKQINAEVTRFLQHLRTTDYSVDIIHVKGLGLWPTWSIPALPETPYINSVYAIVRTLDQSAALPDHTRDESEIDPGWRCNNVFLTYLNGLLSTLFNRGPGFLDRSRSHLEDDARVAHTYVVNHIIIDIVSPTKASGQDNILAGDEQSNTRHGRLIRLRGNDGNPQSPEERLAGCMIWLLDQILGPRAHLPHIGMILYEQIIGSFVFMVNGREVRTIDIEERLQQWRARRPAQEHIFNKKEYQEWKHWVDGRRARMKEGLRLDNTRPATIDLWGGQWNQRVGAN